MRRLAGLVVTTIAVVGTLAPLSAAALAKPRNGSEDKHDCRQTAPKGGYVCEKGPLAGKTFPSRTALVEALRQEPRSIAARPARSAPSVHKLSKTKASVR